MEKQPRCCELHPGLWSGRTGVSRLCSAASPETGLGREQALLLLFTRSVVSNSFLTPWTVAHQAPLPWDSPGKNTGVGCHFLLQGIFLMQGLNLCVLHWQVDSLPLSHHGSPLRFHNFKMCVGSPAGRASQADTGLRAPATPTSQDSGGR